MLSRRIRTVVKGGPEAGKGHPRWQMVEEKADGTGWEGEEGGESKAGGGGGSDV